LIKIKNPVRNVLFFSLVFIISFFVANRDLSIGSDSYNYARIFEGHVGGYLEVSFGYMFLGMMNAVSFFSGSYKIFFFLVSLVVLTGTQISLKKLFFAGEEWPENKEILFFLLLSLILLSPFFFALQVNVLRHGLSAPFLMLFYQSFLDKRYRASLAFGIVSVGFHWTAAYYILLAPLLFLSLRNLIAVASVMSFLYLFGLTQTLFTQISNVSGLKYFYQFASEYGSSSDYQAGIRYDFWLFTSIFIILVALLERILRPSYKITKMMLVTFLPFLAIGYLPYSDRLLAFSWFLLPLVALYGFIFFIRWFGTNFSFVFCAYLLIGSVSYSIYRVFLF
tara:strand:+ start:274 stop:1281 length:1008 start_codon:yes stop_codon:yes gene_type:complete